PFFPKIVLDVTSLPPDSSLPTLTRAGVRELDRLAIEEFGIPGVVLMENAGRALSEAIRESVPELRRALILCGGGNNGGDGYVVARYLADHGVHVTLVETAAESLAPDAATFRQVCVALGIQRVALGAGERLSRALRGADAYDVVIDALLGTGFQGALRGAAALWLAELNELAGRWSAHRIAIDAPSGMDVDTGVAATACFRADLTLTLAANKPAYVRALASSASEVAPANPGQPSAQAVRAFTGEVRVLPIGIPRAVYRALASS
ncbi:UNVERIFIED_CONTAM: hypothetical protein GTU68_027605, partial [Idotea baltica]|nr:hypothetical protein [Idotea baltica]